MEIGEFPFYYAQIAPFNYNKGEEKGKNSAFLREAQMKCLRYIPSSGMIVLTDVGDAHTIHPMEKKLLEIDLLIWLWDALMVKRISCNRAVI